MTQEDIIAAEEYAAKETSEYCTTIGVDEYDEKGFRTPIASKMYDNFYRTYLFPKVDYTIKNTGGISINTVGGHK